MATFLVLDKDNNAVNSIIIDGESVIKYEGPWGAGWKWDGEKCIDPNPIEPIIRGEPDAD